MKVEEELKRPPVMSGGLPGSKLLTLKYGTVRPGVRKLALASKARQSKLLFHQRNKKVVAAKTQDRLERGVAQLDQRPSASRVPAAHN
jgi:hypothetical protein